MDNQYGFCALYNHVVAFFESFWRKKEVVTCITTNVKGVLIYFVRSLIIITKATIIIHQFLGKNPQEKLLIPAQAAVHN
jgi:hypothetical protein